MRTRYKGKTALKSRDQKIAKRCHKKAVVAMARNLAVTMHAMWRNGMVHADRLRADDMSDAAPTAKDRKLLQRLGMPLGDHFKLKPARR